jgi:hypothetical protein
MQVGRRSQKIFHLLFLSHQDPVFEERSIVKSPRINLSFFLVGFGLSLPLSPESQRISRPTKFMSLCPFFSHKDKQALGRIYVLHVWSSGVLSFLLESSLIQVQLVVTYF